MTEDFNGWLGEYIEFRKAAYSRLVRPIPSDIGGLQLDLSDLEPVRAEAERNRAMGVALYYRAKLKHVEKFREQGWAMSAVGEVSKAASFRELWGKEDSESLCRSLESRAIRCSQLLKQMGGS